MKIFSNRHTLAFVAMFTVAFYGLSDEAAAACLPAGPYNNAANVVVCSPGIGESFDTLGGHDSVTIDAGNVGAIVTGTGRDTVILNNGSVVSLDTGSDNDIFTLNNGNINTAIQGSGRDTFNLNNGSIISIDQGTGRDTATMTGGIIGSLLQGSGSDNLTISGGAVTVIVDQGSFADTLDITGGNINEIDQGTGDDFLTIENAITGNIDQGGGVDTFTMNAGALVDFLDQGAGFDVATVNGGRIIGLFEDGDRLDFHGGRIGSINLRQADNIFIMDGTTGAVSVDSFVNAEQGDDLFTLTSGTIGTFVNTGSGDDTVTVDGTIIGTDIITERGDDIVILLSGVVNGDVLTGNDNDTVTLNGATVVGDINTGNGNDTVDLLAGNANSNVITGNGNDTITLAGAIVGGDINAGDGDDSFVWSAGTVARFDGGDGSDTAVVTAASYDGTTVLDGGDDALVGDGFIDTLTLNGVSATVNGGNIVNWEVLNFINSTLTVNGLNIATLNVCGGSTTLGGAGVLDDVLGCVANDTIIVTGTTVIANLIEGAGGNDVISITGNSSVTGGVFGDGNGQDASGGSPGNDTITINTTGTIGLVDSGAGNDVINLLNGTVIGDVLAQTGNDTITLAGAVVGGDINAGDGDDAVDLNSGAVTGNVLTEAGNDTITLAGAVVGGDINAGDGDDIVDLNSGAVTGNVLTEAGNDTITLAGATVGGDINAGDGVDIVDLNSGAVTGNVLTEAGNDTITLAGATVGGDINAGDGDDGFVWSSGTLVRFVGGDGSDTATITAASFNASHILDGGDDVGLADGFEDTLNLNGIVATLNGGNIVNWENVVFNAGTTISFADNALTAGILTINNGAQLSAGGAFALTGNLVIANGGRFVGAGGGAGAFSASGNVTNNGLIDLSDAGAGDRFTVAGNYSGAGALNLDTVLGDSGSATDQLIINGDSSGTTVISVTNVGGAGGLTGNGATDGIQVVQVDGSSDAIFTLAAPVSAGVFNYSLVKSDDQNWYLQSALLSQIYGYSAVMAVLNEDVDMLWQRRSLRRELLNRDGSINVTGSGFWSRGIYGDTSLTSTVNVDGALVQNHLHTIRSITQFGYEQRLTSNKAGFLSAGVFGHYKHFTLGVRDAVNANLANVKANGFGGGASLTWNSRKGFYGDLLGQITSYKVKVDGGSSGAGKFNALTYSTSAEIGYRVELANSARIVPMAQLTWRGSTFDNLIDSAGTVINWNEKNVFTGRIGLALEGGKTIAEGGNGLTGYVIANLLHDFNSGGSVDTSGSRISSHINRTRGQIRLGANLISENNKINLFSDVGFSHSLSGKSYSQFKGVAGLKINF